jgi:hypothetical protein
MASFNLDEMDNHRSVIKFLRRRFQGYDTTPDLKWGYVIYRTNYDPEEVSDEQWKETVKKLRGYARAEVMIETTYGSSDRDPRPNEEIARRFEFVEIEDPQLHKATLERLREHYWKARQSFPPLILMPYAIALYIDKRCVETILAAPPPEANQFFRDGKGPFFKVVDCSFQGAGPAPDPKDFVQVGPTGHMRFVDPELTTDTTYYLPQYKGWMRAEIRVLWHMWTDIQVLGMARCIHFANTQTGDFLYIGGGEEYLNPIQFLNESA